MNAAMAEVIAINGRMTAADYEAERARIRDTWGDTSEEAKARRDQALAALFYRSGWTQEELAKKEHCTRQSMAYRLRFGKFLDFATTVAIPSNLTERRFRGFWEQTDKAEKNERIRFARVAELMAGESRIAKSTARKTRVGNAIVAEFADGQWHKFETLVEHTGATPEDVRTVLETMVARGTYGCHCEKKPVGRSHKYRIIPKGRTVDYDAFIKDLAPILEGLEAEGKKNMATASPMAVATLTHRLKALIEQWASKLHKPG